MKSETKVSVVVVTRDRKEELIKCLDSLISQTVKPFEIIVLDNASKRSSKKIIAKKFPKVIFMESKINTGGAGGRNIGLEKARGNLILFMDDDAWAHPDMIKEMRSSMLSKKKVGIVQPKIYEDGKNKIIQGLTHDINLKTGRVKGVDISTKDIGQYKKDIKIPMAGCTWMVKRDVFEKIGDYDEDFFIPYEDSDFSLRAKRAGFDILLSSKAMVWHKGIKKTSINPKLSWLGITTPERAYRVSKNKIIFMKKHATNADFVVFLLLFLPIYTVLHSLIIASTRRFDILVDYWRGLFGGIDYSLLGTKHFLLSFTDPVSWIIDKESESILDVACGRGMPMMILKKRKKYKKLVGVDLFEPYINECRRKGVYDECIFADARKLPFKNNSFDTVIALQVLEHLEKKQAIAVIKKLEKIARRQVILSTPIGKTFHPAVDGNKLQLHKSGFMPNDFEDLGYKVLKMGVKKIQGEKGLVNKYDSEVWRKTVYVFVLLITPILYIMQPMADWYMVAYKSLD